MRGFICSFKLQRQASPFNHALAKCAIKPIGKENVQSYLILYPLLLGEEKSRVAHSVARLDGVVIQTDCKGVTRGCHPKLGFLIYLEKLCQRLLAWCVPQKL